MKLNEFIYGLTLTTPANLTRPNNISSDIGHSNPWLLGYIDDVLRIAVGLYQEDTPVEYFYMEAITGLIGNFMIHTLAHNEAIGLFNLSDTTLAAARHQNALKSAVYSGAPPRSALINMSKPDLERRAFN